MRVAVANREHEQSNALVFETEPETYGEVLRAMLGENRLSSLGAHVKSYGAPGLER